MSRKVLVAALAACAMLLTIAGTAMASAAAPTCVEKQKGTVHVQVGYCP
jgi:hypothetical protein